MKLADLKTGGIYALRYGSHPYLLLSTDMYKMRTERTGPAKWSKAEPGKRPKRARRDGWHMEHDDYVLIMLEGPDVETLTGMDPAPILEALVTGGTAAVNQIIPMKASIILATALPSILGPFAQVRAARDAEKAREIERKQHEVDRYNTNVDTLNALAGHEVLRHQRLSEFSEPKSTLVLAPSDVQLIAERRDEETRKVRALLDAVELFMSRYAFCDADACARMAVTVAIEFEAVKAAFGDRIADLDHRAAQLPDGGLVDKP